MISIAVKTDGQDIADEIKTDKPTLEECALINLRLDQMKKELMSMEFKSKFEVREGSFADEGLDGGE